MNWILGIGFALAVGALAFLAYVLVNNRLFDDRIQKMREEMAASKRRSGGGPIGLPDIVESFAIKAGGREGGPVLFRAEHKAGLAIARDQAPIAIDAVQWTGTQTPGLVWKAHGSIMGLPVTVVDSYVSGEGVLEARIAGAFKVAGGSGPDYDRGELMRYLSELPVYPDAILNAEGLTWRQLDKRTVEVSGRSRSGAAAVRFLFDEGGDIVAMQADERPMTVDGKTVPTPWRGTYSNYRRFGSYRIPAHGEVGWVLPDGLFTYWKGELTAYEAIP